jgi:Flp pilus assembly secretin CpaC
MLDAHGWLATVARLLLMTVFVACPMQVQAQAITPPPDVVSTAPVSVLTLPVGQSLLMRYPNIRRVSAADGSVVDVKVFDDTQDVMVLGKKEGLTDLRLWTRDGNTLAYLVRVLGIPDPPPTAPRLEAVCTAGYRHRLGRRRARPGVRHLG